jgi:hypothetical protein
LPAWAVGSFTRHRIDVELLVVESDGTVLMKYDGGDNGGHGCGRAKVVGGNVVIENRDGTPSTFELIRDADAAVWKRTPHGSSAFEVGAMCGRDVGGCGGFGHVAPCSPRELESIAALVDECRGPGPGVTAPARAPSSVQCWRC